MGSVKHCAPWGSRRRQDPHPRPGQAEVQGDVQLGRKSSKEWKTGPLNEISSWWLNSRTVFPTVAALVGLQMLPQYEYSVPIKYAQYGKARQGEDLEGSMNFITALLSCRGMTDAAIDLSVQASPSFERSSSLFAFHNSVITPHWQQDKEEVTVQLFIPRVLLCNNQQW